MSSTIVFHPLVGLALFSVLFFLRLSLPLSLSLCLHAPLQLSAVSAEISRQPERHQEQKKHKWRKRKTLGEGIMEHPPPLPAENEMIRTSRRLGQHLPHRKEKKRGKSDSLGGKVVRGGKQKEEIRGIRIRGSGMTGRAKPRERHGEKGRNAIITSFRARIFDFPLAAATSGGGGGVNTRE